MEGAEGVSWGGWWRERFRVSACERNTHTEAPSGVTSQGRGPLVNGLHQHPAKECATRGTGLVQTVSSPGAVLKANVALFQGASSCPSSSDRDDVKGKKWATHTHTHTYTRARARRRSREMHNTWSIVPRSLLFLLLSLNSELTAAFRLLSWAKKKNFCKKSLNPSAASHNKERENHRVNGKRFKCARSRALSRFIRSLKGY